MKLTLKDIIIELEMLKNEKKQIEKMIKALEKTEKLYQSNPSQQVKEEVN